MHDCKSLYMCSTRVQSVSPWQHYQWLAGSFGPWPWCPSDLLAVQSGEKHAHQKVPPTSSRGRWECVHAGWLWLADLHDLFRGHQSTGPGGGRRRRRGWGSNFNVSCGSKCHGRLLSWLDRDFGKYFLAPFSNPCALMNSDLPYLCSCLYCLWFFLEHCSHGCLCSLHHMIITWLVPIFLLSFI